MKNFVFIFLLFTTYFSFAQDTIVQDTNIINIDTLISLDTIQQIEEITPDVAVENFVSEIDTALTNSIQLKKKKFTIDRVRIMFGLNFSPYTPLAIENDNFNGEYFPVKDSASVYTERNTKNNLSKNYKVGNIQFFLQANVWKGLFVGMNYQFLTIKNYKKDPNLGNLLSKKSTTFFLVSANFGYAFDFLKNKCLQLQPSIRIGGYTADDYYDRGTGKKFYFGADVKLRYLIKRKAGFSVGVDYDFIRYKKKGYSDIFERDTYQKTTFNNVGLNVGFVYNISINTNKK